MTDDFRRTSTKNGSVHDVNTLTINDLENNSAMLSDFESVEVELSKPTASTLICVHCKAGSVESLQGVSWGENCCTIGGWTADKDRRNVRRPVRDIHS